MIASSIYHCIILYILVDYLDWGIYGCSWGTLITYVVNTLILSVYCMRKESLKESFFFPTKECFENMWDYFKIGIPSSAMISIEWWSFELQAVMSSYLGILYGGSMVIMINTLVMTSMVPYGASIVAAVLIGNSLGEGKPKKAVLYLKLVTGYTLFSTAVVSGLLLLLRN